MKLDNYGFSHLAVAAIVIVVSGIVGTAYLVYSSAASKPPSSWPDELTYDEGAQSIEPVPYKLSLERNANVKSPRKIYIRNNGKSRLYVAVSNCSKKLKTGWISKGKTKSFSCGKRKPMHPVTVHYMGLSWSDGPNEKHVLLKYSNNLIRIPNIKPPKT